MGTDRRVRYTKMMIREAFYRLLEEKPLERITVKELCLEADINRATFYRYYRDVLDLAECLEKEIIQQIFEKTDQNTAGATVRMLTVIRDNRVLYRELFRSDFQGDFLRDFLDQEQQLAKDFMKQNGTYKEKSFPYAWQYILNGYIGMIRKWVEKGCQEAPEEFSKIMSDVTGGCAMMD